MTERRCDECGRLCTKWTRVHKGRGYCATCYAREFELQACPSCGRQARLLRRDVGAVCRACERGQPCARCGATKYETGCLTAYGPVCNACAPYFREERRCALCGALSHKLSRVLRLGIDVQICPKCQRADHGTCALCRRSRRVEVDAQGRKVCRACRESGIVACPGCGEPMPAGRGRQCEACYWRSLLERRVAISRETFPTVVGGDRFQQFATWLHARVGPKKAAQTVNRYLDFFRQLSAQGDLLDAGTLLVCFTTQGLRRNQLPMRFLEATGLLLVGKEAKEEASERRRIVDMLGRFPPESTAARLLNGYRAKLVGKMDAGASTLRSVRLALSPAATLLALATELGRMPPDQFALDAFLKRTPGQRAAVSGFVSYLRETCGAVVSFLKRLAVSRQEVERALAEMLVAGLESDRERKRALTLALTYFHGVRAEDARWMANLSAVDSDRHGGWALIHKGRRFTLPDEFAHHLKLICK